MPHAPPRDVSDPPSTPGCHRLNVHPPCPETGGSILNRNLQWWLLGGLIFLILFARSPGVLLLPPLQAEDGSHVFAYFYEHREPIQILREKGGYIPLLANLIGYLSVRLPATMIPYGLTWLPLLLTLAAYSLFFSRRYRVIIASDAVRALVCLLFALAPLSQFHLLAHTDYSIWNALLLLILLGGMPLPAGSARAAPCWLLINLLVWAHPLSIVLLPLQLHFAWRDRSRRAWYLATTLNLVLYQYLGTKGGQVFAHQDLLSILALLGRSLVATVTMLGDIASRTVLGQPLFAWARQHMGFLIVYVDLAVILLVGCAAVLDAGYRRLVWVLLYLMAGMTFLSLLSRGLSLADLETYSGGPRYCYLQSLGVLVLLAGGVSSLLHSPAGRRALHPALPSPGRMISAAALLHYYLLNTQYGHYLVFNADTKDPAYQKSPYYPGNPMNGRIVQTFFRDLAASEANPQPGPAQRLVAEKPGDWPIDITVGGAASPDHCPSTRRLCRLVQPFD